MMKKYFYSGFGIIGILALIASMAVTHTAVGVASCDYCKMKTVAEVQSDSLDAVAENETKKDAIIIADNKIHIDKVKADVVVAASFNKTYEKVKAYAEKEKVTDNNIDIVADAEFTASVFARFDQTAEYYRVATNTLISNDSASMGSRQAIRYKQIGAGSSGNTASGAIAKSGKQLCSAGCDGSGTAEIA